MGRDRDDEGRFARRGGSYEGRGQAVGSAIRKLLASRAGEPRHGESGWYGDTEGHSEASRRGWEGRQGGSPRYEERSPRYDEMPSRNSRSQDDDATIVAAMITSAATAAAVMAAGPEIRKAFGSRARLAKPALTRVSEFIRSGQAKAWPFPWQKGE